MKSITQLTRNCPVNGNFFRGKGPAVDMMLRKQYRRAKKINYFSKDYTNQSNPNAWFNAKKYKALVLHYQQIRNMHRGTNPISLQNKKQITQKFTQDSHWQYFNYRNHLKQHIELEQYQKTIDLQKQISTLPAKLRQQVQSLKHQKMPQMILTNFHFSQQYQIFLPADQRYRRNLLLRIQNPPKDKSLQEDQQ